MRGIGTQESRGIGLQAPDSKIHKGLRPDRNLAAFGVYDMDRHRHTLIVGKHHFEPASLYIRRHLVLPKSLVPTSANYPATIFPIARPGAIAPKFCSTSGSGA